MAEERFRNQARLLDPDKIAGAKIVVIGAGAIGSFVAMTLSKMGAKNIIVYDDDKIEDHNFANQLYPVEHLGRKKVDALLSVCQDYGDALIETKDFRWHPDNAVDGDIIIIAVDNMDARKAMWDYYKTREIKFFLEGRMSAQVWRVYGIDPKNDKDVALYEKNLYPQAEAAEERCGEKSIIYTVLSVASEMASQVKSFIQGEYRPSEVICDCLNRQITNKYNMEIKYETIEVPEEAILA